MKIFISPDTLKGRIPIYDSGPLPKINNTKEYQLIFESGEITLKVLKEFFLKGKDAYFQVKNLEYFIQRLGALFRNLEIIVIKGDFKTTNEYEDFYCGKTSRQRQYAKLQCKFRKLHKKPKVPIDFAKVFCPQILESVKTSLDTPETYKTEMMPCHRIYSLLLDGPKGYEVLSCDVEQTALESSLKSLIYYGVVKQKNSLFFINPVFK
ncbi:hypothetical protein PAEPH01_0199 [Pancytospora epiphaga]|nr:hypothetical protein PAEPH01_0199 [Pancytospora epiphaga]